MHKKHQLLVLMGPTGSGKSAMAIRIAQARPAVIINADAMQMVADLRILTARPTLAEEAAAEHALYGVLPATTPTSVALWLELAVPQIRQAWAQGKLPLLVGGTGMYVAALMQGLAVVPEIPAAVRAEVRARAARHPIAELHAQLAQRDPAAAAALKPGDTQRILRALEVIEATGKSLEFWQQQATIPPLPEAEFRCFYVNIPRPQIYAQINQRFETMMRAGALAEVEALLAQRLPASLPILRAHGVPELTAYLEGAMPLAQAIEKAQQNTRNYAKRQLTWIRNQLPEAVGVGPDATPGI